MKKTDAKSSFRKVVIVGGLRTPFVKSFSNFGELSNQDLLSTVIDAMTEKYSLDKVIVGDVVAGAVMMHSSDWNLTREVVLGSKLDSSTPAFNVQRACGTSLEAANLIALKISSGQIDVGIAGGSDTNSDLPVTLRKSLAKRLVSAGRARSLADKVKALAGLSFGDLKPIFPGVVEPRTKLSMGQHTEKMAKDWNISRAAQDELALASHSKAAAAYERGFYDDLIVATKGLAKDSIVRADTTLDRLAKLKPAFDPKSGSLTAGNSTPLTDGAAGVLLADEETAKSNGWPILARFVDCEVAAVDFVSGDEGLLIAPAHAVSRLLKRNDLSLQDFDLYEIHEAFAAQVLCTLKAWESEDYCRQRLKRDKAMGSIDRSKMNVNGGSVALGHPFAATGARIVAGLAKELKLRGGGRGLISICTAGGMGVAAIIEA